MSAPSVMINANFSLHAKTNAVSSNRQDAQSAVAKSSQYCSPTTLVGGCPKILIARKMRENSRSSGFQRPPVARSSCPRSLQFWDFPQAESVGCSQVTEL